MYAYELNGAHINTIIEYTRGEALVSTENITMITHKKNGNVLVRHGKNNRQVEFKSNKTIFEQGEF